MDDADPPDNRAARGGRRLWRGPATVAGLLVAWLLLHAVTGQGLGAPSVVVVQSGSMMACEEGAGNLAGACTPTSWAGARGLYPGTVAFVCDGGGAGDVLVYQADGGRRTVHRAHWWLDIAAEQFRIDALGIAATDLDDPRLSAAGLHPDFDEVLGAANATTADSGWLTRGDNNPWMDPLRTAAWPVREEWVEGHVCGHIPWLGFLNVKVNDLVGGTDHAGDAPPSVQWMGTGLPALGVAGLVIAAGRRRGWTPWQRRA